MRSPSLIALLLTLCAVPSFSGQREPRDNQPVYELSFEDTSCGKWMTDTQGRQTYLYWFRGFASGYNLGSPDYQIKYSSMPNPETLALYIDKFCRENPLLPFTSAAFSLVKEQRTRRE